MVWTFNFNTTCTCKNEILQALNYNIVMFFLFDCVSFTGVHAEGLFINRNKKDTVYTHQEAHIQDTVSLSQLQSCYGTLDNIRMITLAPELPGAMEVIPNLGDRGIVVALGKQISNQKYMYM